MKSIIKMAEQVEHSRQQVPTFRPNTFTFFDLHFLATPFALKTLANSLHVVFAGDAPAVHVPVLAVASRKFCMHLFVQIGLSLHVSKFRCFLGIFTGPVMQAAKTPGVSSQPSGDVLQIQLAHVSSVGQPWSPVGQKRSKFVQSLYTQTNYFSCHIYLCTRTIAYLSVVHKKYI